MLHPLTVSSAYDATEPDSGQALSLAGIRHTTRGWIFALLLMLPLLAVGLETARWIRNIPRWDEFDTTLDLLVTMDSGAGWSEVGQRLVASHNEHRMVVSRSIFAASYWLSGGINFALIAVLGNVFLLGSLVHLAMASATAAARWRTGAILALIVVQLQHHENLFWGGASIDHFFVLFAAVSAIRALLRPGRWSIAGGCIWGVLGTFSLAHGIVVWPAGLVLLVFQRRWKAAAAWAATAVTAVALFLRGFEINPGHQLPGLQDLATVGTFWCRLLGSSVALDDIRLAPWLGLVFVLAFAWIIRRGWSETEQLAIGTIGWCLGAMALVALGRAVAAPAWMPVSSRYFILSSMAWAALATIAVERALARWPRRRMWWQPLFFAGLVAFNVAADITHAGEGREMAKSSELAVRAYRAHGTFANSQDCPYPDPERADALIAEVERRGIYRLPGSEDGAEFEPTRIELDEPTEISRASYFIEEVATDTDEMRVKGWAFPWDHTLRFGELRVVLRSDEGLFALEPMARLRPDVAETYSRWDASNSGFELHVPKASLPPGRFEIGICFNSHLDPEYMMTANSVVIPKL